MLRIEYKDDSQTIEMRFRVLPILVPVLLFVAPSIRAATPATAQSAATTTTAPAGDPSTPLGALHLLAQALSAGDRAAILARLLAESEPEKHLAGATADLAEATAALRRAGVAAFGESSAAPLGADLSASPEALKRIDAARVDQEGDRATVRPAETDGPPIVLVKRDGVWRVPVSELLKDVESADVQKSIDAMNAQSKAMKALTADISAGKFKSALEARQELDRRIVQSALPRTSDPDADRKPR